MDLVDFAPFVVVLLVGAVAGAFVPGHLAWWVALFVPAAHFALSVVTGRASEDSVDYVLPVNVLLLGIAIIGLLSGRRLRLRLNP
jgi:hypothetical protein